jgi:uncharacterized SAM-binding protein YcdF (DUF218 family)
MNRSGWGRFQLLLGVSVLGGAGLWATNETWLTAMGTALVASEKPVKADIGVVLAGDWQGGRIMTAAGLVRDGFIPQVLVSGPAAHYDYTEDQLAIAFAVKRGFPESYFFAYPVEATSTKTEAEAIVPELRRRGVKRVLVVTSDYHTRRAGRLWRGAAAGMDVRLVSSPDPFFARGWWRFREGRKRFFYEWVKVVTSPFGI